MKKSKVNDLKAYILERIKLHRLMIASAALDFRHDVIDQEEFERRFDDNDNVITELEFVLEEIN